MADPTLPPFDALAQPPDGAELPPWPGVDAGYVGPQGQLPPPPTALDTASFVSSPPPPLPGPAGMGELPPMPAGLQPAPAIPLVGATPALVDAPVASPTVESEPELPAAPEPLAPGAQLEPIPIDWGAYREAMAAPDVQAALDIQDPDMRTAAIARLAEFGDPRAQIALEGERAAKLEAQAAESAAEARAEYSAAVDAERRRRERERAQQDEARTAAAGVLAQRTDELAQLRDQGVPPATGKELAGLALMAIGRHIASGGRDPVDISAAVDGVIQRKAASYAQQLAERRAAVGEARLDIEAAGDELAQADRDSVLVQRELYEQLGRQLQGIAAQTRSEQTRNQAESAAQVALGKAQAAAQQAAIDEEGRQMKLAEQRVKLGKTVAETQLAQAKAAEMERKARGRGRAPSLLSPELKGFSKADRKRIEAQGVRDPASGKYLTDERGVPVIAPSPGEAKDLRATWIASKTVTDQLNAVKAIRKKYGAKDWASLGPAGQSKAKQELESWGAQLVAEMNRALKLGALDQGTLDVFKRMLGDTAGLWNNTAKLDAVLEGVERGFNDKVRGLTGARTRVQFARVREAPRATLKSVRTRLQQQPDITAIERGGEVNLSARKRIANLDQMYDLHLEEAGGDPARASEAFEADVNLTRKLAESGRSKLQAELAKEYPDNFSELQTELVSAMGSAAAVGADATPDNVAEARARVDRARLAVQDALTPRARALQAAIDQENRFLDELKKRSGREERRQRESAEAKRKQRELEAVRAPSGARPGVF